MERGWVKLYRQIVEWEWFKEPATAHLFIYLLAKANREPAGYKGVDIPAGGLTTSLKALADATGLTIMQVRTSLKHLISTQEVTKIATPKYTLLIVNNWDLYQVDNTISNKRTTNEQQTNNKQITTNKNIRSKNKEVRSINSTSGLPPDLDEIGQVITYLNEKAGKRFNPGSKASRSPVSARINEGARIEDLKAVIDIKVSQWKGDPKMDAYLTPQTLFRPANFEIYLNEVPKNKATNKEQGQAEYGGLWL